MSARSAMKSAARALALAIVSPRLLAYHAAASIIGRERALQSSTQALAGVPGLRGEYLRRAFLMHAIEACDPETSIGFGTVFSKLGARIGPNVYIGLNCHLGLVTLERGVLLADWVHIPSGGHIHGTEDVSRPIRDQEGRVERVTIGEGTWIGAGAIVMADVGAHSIVAAGSVVTHPIPPFVVAAGVPARVIKERSAVRNDTSGRAIG